VVIADGLVILVSNFEASAVGHGGNHRTYQVRHDLEQVVGPENVHVVRWPVETETEPGGVRLESAASRVSFMRRVRGSARRVAPLRNAAGAWRTCGLRRGILETGEQWRNRLYLASRNGHTLDSFSSSEFLAHYSSMAARLGRPAVCVLEHVGFAGVLPINDRAGIPTVSCFQNLDPFDMAAPLRPDDRDKSYLAAVDLMNEFWLLAQFRSRLCISRVEAGLLGGLGLSAQHYPYRPVGAIRERLEGIRERRAGCPKEPGLFVMVGSAGHPTTYDSFSWFVNNARRHGLPLGVRVWVGGSRTEQLLPPGVTVPGLELRGWLGQDELDDLLSRAQAAIVVQNCGFGAVTRLVELSCAGIPTLVSRHLTLADDVPPGAQVAGDDWRSWCAGMERIVSHGVDLHAGDYERWETSEPNALMTTISRILAEQSPA
jgi:hypothetical protein